MSCNKVILQLGDLLFWKDAAILKRRPFLGGMLLLLPVLIATLPLSMHATRDKKNAPKSQIFTRERTSGDLKMPPDLKDINGITFYPGKIAYTPQNKLTTRIMDGVINEIGMWVEAEGLSSDETLEERLKENEESRDYLGGVTFTSITKEDIMPQDIRYKIRMYTPDQSSFQTGKIYLNTARLTYRRKYHRDYYSSGFLTLQLAVERTILAIMCQNQTYSAKVSGMILPRLSTDDFFEYVATLQPSLIVCSFLVYCVAISKDVVGDKENKIRLKLNMIGVSNFVIWLAYFLKYFLLIFLSYTIHSVLMLSGISKYGPLLGSTDALLVLILMLLYFLAAITFCFALTTFFTSSSTAVFISLIIFLATFAPSVPMMFNPSSTSAAVKGLLCIFPNVALHTAFEIITQRLELQVPLAWGNVNEPTFSNQLSFAIVLIMLAVDIVLYSLLTWYLENVQPTSGIPKPLYFPFTRTYWLGRKPSREHRLEPLGTGLPELFEPIQPNTRIGIQTQRLTKEYVGAFNDTAAINCLDVDMLQGQISVILGPQGAGKSTLVSMLTCVVTPTSGTAFVDGFDITKDQSAVHSAVGCCPDENIFFNYLTVEENLRFFGRLRGISYKRLKDAVDNMLQATGLRKNRRTLAKNLPVAQMRMLTVAQSLMGNPKVVILDEPTKGMDPSTRHHVWGLLKKLKRDKTILCTTEFEDEAEHLGDRVGIMANGTLQCYGSANFLKNSYAAGYHLIISKTPDCRVDSVTAYVQKHMPNALLEKSVTTEMVFSMPVQDAGMFEEVFRDLEAAQKDIGILGYSVCISSLEEMYFRVVEEDEMDLRELMLKNAEISKFKQRLSKVIEIGRKMTKFFAIDVEKGGTRARLSHRNTLQGSARNARDSAAFTRKKTLVDVKFDKVNKSDTPTAKVATVKAEGADVDSILLTEHKGDTQKALQETSKNESANPDDEDFEALRRQTTRQSRPVISRPLTDNIKLYAEHMKGLLIKSVRHSCRSIISSVIMLLLPILLAISFLIASLLLIAAPNTGVALDELHLTVTQYESPLVSFAGYGDDGNMYADAWRKQFPSTVEVSNITSAIYTKKIMDADHFHSRALLNWWKTVRSYILSARFRETDNGLDVKVYYNTEPYHVEPIAWNSIHNAILKSSQKLEGYTMHLTNHPIPTTKTRQVAGGIIGTQMRLFVTSASLALASILPAFFSMFKIREYVSNAKHMQLVSGVLPLIYWSAAFIWDFFFYSVGISLMSVIFVAINAPEYQGGRLGIFTMAFFLYGFAVLPLLYLLCHAFDKPVAGLELIIICFGVTSLLPLSLTKATETYILAPGLTEFLNTLFQLFLPQYNLGKAIWDMGFQNKDNYLAWNETGSCMFFLFFNGCLYWIAIALTEKYGNDPAVERCWQIAQCEPKPQIVVGNQSDEDDVQDEETRVNEKQTFADEAIIFQAVSKCYGERVAVDRLTFGVPVGSFFGLLGMNQTGKTTIFKLITGQESLTSGSIFIKGYDVTEELYDTRPFIGYCPQNDDFLHSWMTGEESIMFYGRLRGVAEEQLRENCTNLINALGLDVFCKERIKTYSDPKRRLVAIAIALVSDPQILLLDNPTSHLDPVAKMKVKQVLNQKRALGSTIFMSSHSMAECEELCSTIAIIADGSFQCIGSVPHLISKYGKGCTLVVRLKEMDDETIASDRPVRDFMAKTFPGSFLIDDDKERLTFQIRETNMNWAEIHKVVDNAKEKLNLESFYVIQAALTQIFMSFAFHRKKR